MSRLRPPTPHEAMIRAAGRIMNEWEELIHPSPPRYPSQSKRSYHLSHAGSVFDDVCDEWRLGTDEVLRAGAEVIEWAKDEVDTETLWVDTPTVAEVLDEAEERVIRLTAKTPLASMVIDFSLSDDSRYITHFVSSITWNPQILTPPPGA